MEPGEKFGSKVRLEPGMGGAGKLLGIVRSPIIQGLRGSRVAPCSKANGRTGCGPLVGHAPETASPKPGRDI